jgi:16S rRNA processing protein RimM
MASSAPATILAARIGAPHGVRGEVRLISFTADPLAVADYESLAFADGRPARIAALREQGKALVARFEGVNDRDAAQRLTNAELFIDRDELPEPEEDEFYIADLVGLAAFDPQGNEAGTVIAVQDFGAGDILEIRPPQGATFMVAFTRENVPLVEIGKGRLTLVRPPETTAGEEEA